MSAPTESEEAKRLAEIEKDVEAMHTCMVEQSEEIEHLKTDLENSKRMREDDAAEEWRLHGAIDARDKEISKLRLKLETLEQEGSLYEGCSAKHWHTENKKARTALSINAKQRNAVYGSSRPKFGGYNSMPPPPPSTMNPPRPRGLYSAPSSTASSPRYQ
tara:strand:- start:56 stop:535 length:480 start_codon:yes stop_codon:yes gene_type:complete